MSSDRDAPKSDLIRSAEKAVDQEEALRRARQSARTLSAWAQVAGEDPVEILEEIGSDQELATDGGSDCFYCGGTTDYHPTCDKPGCENHTHGSGPEGKLVKSYCPSCRPGDPKLVTDGGMRSFTVGPRVEFSLDHYPRIRVSERGREWYVYLHRLTAFAHGELDALDDGRHVHHVDGDRWNNSPENLEAVASHEHDELHEHTVIADGGKIDSEFCAACTFRVAREDRKVVDGMIYHRQCAPDDAEIRSDGGGLGSEGLSALEDQRDALEDVVEELRYQNAVQTEIARALYILAQAVHDKPSEPPKVPSYRALQGFIEDHHFTREEEGDR